MTIIKRALLSVSDKHGIAELARELLSRGVELLSTGGTAGLLRSNGIAVTDVGEYTGFPEIMDGRVKTLHPKIHGGLLGRAGIDETVMREHDIEPIDLLVVNLYPFETVVARPDCTLPEAVENIDVGGPAMLRAAAKNHSRVAVLVDPADYEFVIEEMDANSGAVTELTRQRLATKAFAHAGSYDLAISAYLDRQRTDTGALSFDDVLRPIWRKQHDLRYGENPHQRAALYAEFGVSEASIAAAVQHQGKELSYNNIVDADAALGCAKQFLEPGCVIVKHANPCGVAVDQDILGAYKRAYSTDPTSAFGGIIAVNRALDAGTAAFILKQQFVEVIIAPEIEPAALESLQSKTNVRVLSTGWWDSTPVPGIHYQNIIGGLLVQTRDIGLASKNDLRTVTEREPSEHETSDLLFAWKVAKFVKSNAIVFAKDRMTVGVGAGQMSRVYSARIAAMKAVDGGLAVKGSVMASDAFFPFRDGIDRAAENGVTAVIQPGGSRRDDEVIAAADEHGMAMVFTGMRHFRH